MKRTWWQTSMDWFSVLVMMVLMLTCWLSPAIRGKVFWYANVIFFCPLVALLFSQIDWLQKIREKEKEIYILMAGVGVSIANLFLSKSNIGAVFTILNFLLMLYLADKVILSRKMIYSLTLTCIGIVLYWVLYKHVTFETAEFNTNGVSHAICTPMFLGVYGMCWLLEDKIKWGRKKRGILFFFTSIIALLQIISLRARGTALGIITAIFVYYLLPKKKWSAYMILVGTLLIPVIYLLLGNKGLLNIMFAGKRVMSGRDEIWAVFGSSYLHHPIIGIGSNFGRVVPQLEIKEVHHALLDLLFVHGGSVFLFVLYFLIKRFRGLFGKAEKIAQGSRTALALSYLYGMIIIGTFENYYIVAPCSTVFFLILVLEYQKLEKGEKLVEEGK